MAETHRVIVTGTNKAGKSVVVEEAQAAMIGPGNFDFWQTKAGQSPHDLADRPLADEVLSAAGRHHVPSVHHPAGSIQT